MTRERISVIVSALAAGALIAAVGFALSATVEKAEHYRQRCAAAGGVLVSGDVSAICIRRDVIVEARD